MTPMDTTAKKATLLSIDTLGLLVSVPLLILISSLAGVAFKWLGVLVNAAVLTLFSWGVFVVGLKLIIPLWPQWAVG